MKVLYWKSILIVGGLLTISPLSAATLLVPEGRLSFPLPSHWTLTGEERGSFGGLFTFNRAPIKDSQGRSNRLKCCKIRVIDTLFVTKGNHNAQLGKHL